LSNTRVREGTIWLLGAQGIFILSSYGMHIYLGRSLGPAEYGLYGVALYATNMIRTFVQSGVPMAVTRYVSADPAQSETIYRSGFRLQLGLSIAVSLLFFIGATPLARLLGDEKLVDLFHLAAPITLFLGLFFLIFQYYNGLKSYRKQAVLLTGSYILRAGLAILLAIKYGVRGAVAGMVLAAIISWVWAAAGRHKSVATGVFSPAVLVNFSTPLILAAVAQALLTDIDIMFVKRWLPGDANAGWYTSAKALAQITPFAFYALSSALYPAVSAAQSSGDQKLLKRYVEQSNRLLLLIGVPITVLGFLYSKEIMGLVYGQQYLTGAAALRWLILSFSLLSFFIIHKTIITGCGYPRLAGFLTLLMLPVCVTLQWVLIPQLGLTGAALATTLTFAVGVLGTLGVIYSQHKSGFDLISTIRIMTGGVVVLAAGLILAQFELSVILKLTLLLLVYLGILRITGEFNLQTLRTLFTGSQFTSQADKIT
jgi:stage V sporulation protein B